MDRELEEMKKKVDAIYGMLSAFSSKSDVKMALENAIQKAIDDLEKTKSSFKSRQIEAIKENLERALARKH